MSYNNFKKIKVFKKKFLIWRVQSASCFFLFVFFQLSNAQNPIPLDKAIEIALKNNNSIKNENLVAAYSKAMIQASADIPKTNVFAEYGQINTNLNDSRFGISQTFALPTVYKRHKQVLTETYNSKVLQTNLKTFEVKKIVTTLFYNYLVSKQKEKLLQKADTLYSKFFEKASLRLQKGESNILEKSTAETQKTNVAIQLQQLQASIEIIKVEFQLALNSDQIYVPNQNNFKAIIENSKIEENPILKIFDQQKNLMSAEISLQKSKLWPEILVGYNNNSFSGIGLDDTKRFHSAQLGLGIPLFGGSQKAQINAMKIAKTTADTQYETQFLKLKNEYAKLMIQYQSNLEIVNILETQSVKNSKTIAEVANKQFINGDINYLDFVMLINQSIAIQNSYIEAITALNDNVISLNYLNFKN